MKTINPAKVDVNGGYLCLWSHWKSDDTSSPETEELHEVREELQTYMPQETDELCICGSEKPYGECCKQEQYWWPICPDPELEGYSLIAPQTFKFWQIDGATLRARFMEDDRLNCTQDSPTLSAWSYWGETAVETPGYGVLGFGELEIKHNHTLFVTVTSDEQRRVILAFLKEIAGDLLRRPEHKYGSLQVYDKRNNKNQTLPPLQWLKRSVGHPG